MASRPTQNTTATTIELPTKLLEEARRHARERDLTLKAVVVTALKRHLAHLPDDAPAPFPDTPSVKRGGK